MKEFFNNFAISEPLEPRNAFFGGQTNATLLFYETQSNEKIQYVDFCSLYPWCNKYGQYPLGHPQIITENFRPIDQYFGMVKCTVLPPCQLYHPVLPYRNQGKLMFPLWRTCADTMQQEYCHHTDADRAMHGTWVALELEKALQKGYQLLKIDGRRHFDVDTFLKVTLISDPAEYFDLLSSDKINVTDANFINDEIIEVHYENTDEFIEANGKTNVVIAAFTTAHACLKLYSVLAQLDRRVLYFDTGSIIYVSKEGEWEPPTGSYLGELTNELDGNHIATFVSGGPKNYSYKMNTSKTVCKVRGIPSIIGLSKMLIWRSWQIWLKVWGQRPLL